MTETFTIRDCQSAHLLAHHARYMAARRAVEIAESRGDRLAASRARRHVLATRRAYQGAVAAQAPTGADEYGELRGEAHTAVTAPAASDPFSGMADRGRVVMNRDDALREIASIQAEMRRRREEG